MRIVFSNYDDIRNPYYGGGGAIAVHEVAKRLAATHTVTVLTGKYPGSTDEIVDGVVYKRVGAHLLDPRIGQLLFHFSLPWFALTMKFDVWVESFTPPFSTALLPLCTRKPVVGLTHLLGGKAMKLKYGLPFDIPERMGLKVYKHVIVLQDALKLELAQMAPHIQTYVIPNGVDAEMLAQPPMPKAGYIAFLGRVDFEQKGLDLLLNAYAKALPRIQLPLRIAGTGLPGDMERLQKLVRELKLENSVSLVGKLSGQAKIDFLNQSEFFVMSSRTENFALVLLEAFALGVPAIVFNIPGVQWVPDTCAIKVPTFNVPNFSDALLDLEAHKEKREAMGAAAKEFACGYSWDAIARTYEAVLTEVAGL